MPITSSIGRPQASRVTCFRLGAAARRRARRACATSPCAAGVLLRAAHRVLAEQRKRDRRVGVGDDGIGQHARVHLAPAHRLGRRGARQAAPHHLVGRDLDEVVVAALGNAVDLPQRGLALQVEVLGRAAAEDDAAVLLAGQDKRAHLVDVLVRIDHQRAAVHQLVVGDVHADRAVARRRGVDRHAGAWRPTPRPSTPRSPADARAGRWPSA